VQVLPEGDDGPVFREQLEEPPAREEELLDRELLLDEPDRTAELSRRGCPAPRARSFERRVRSSSRCRSLANDLAERPT
jgi:hypothetical protein